jgi:hypothetical protein
VVQFRHKLRRDDSCDHEPLKERPGGADASQAERRKPLRRDEPAREDQRRSLVVIQSDGHIGRSSNAVFPL